MTDVTLPSLGESVTEGIITQWFKKVGDTVARDEPLFEVSTDKVDSEMPSPAAGVLVEILAEEGDTVETGSRVAVIDESGAATPKHRTRRRIQSPPKPKPRVNARQLPRPESAARANEARRQRERCRRLAGRASDTRRRWCRTVDAPGQRSRGFDHPS